MVKKVLVRRSVLRRTPLLINFCIVNAVNASRTENGGGPRSGLAKLFKVRNRSRRVGGQGGTSRLCRHKGERGQERRRRSRRKRSEAAAEEEDGKRLSASRREKGDVVAR